MQLQLADSSFIFLKKITMPIINSFKTISLMDNVLSNGISKMPKIPDKNNFHFFLNMKFRKCSHQKFNQIIYKEKYGYTNIKNHKKLV